MIRIIAHPNGHSIGVFENAINYQFGFDFNASNFSEVGFDGLFSFVSDVQVVYFIIEVYVHGELFSYGCSSIIQIA